MSNVHKMFRVLALAVLVGAAIVVQTEAATISISPVTQNANVGDVVNADILVSGLSATESVGGVSLLLSFDDIVLSGLSYIVDPDAKMGRRVRLVRPELRLHRWRGFAAGSVLHR